LSDYNIAIDLDPNNAELYYGRSELYVKKRNLKDAILDAKTAIRLQPNQDKYLNWLNNINELGEDKGTPSGQRR
jgi:tetratricopeptide (TPR) repeat protein